MAPLIPFSPDVLGAELVRLRQDVHLSQRGLAKLSGVSNTQISDLEAGTAPPPHPLLLQKLAQGLATSGSGQVDEQRAEAAYLALMRAAGYLPPEPPEERADVATAHYSADLDELRRQVAGLPPALAEAIIKGAAANAAIMAQGTELARRN